MLFYFSIFVDAFGYIKYFETHCKKINIFIKVKAENERK